VTAGGGVDAAVRLLDEGATVPFIARYRKEATGGLDDIQLRRLEERLGYLRELEERARARPQGIDERASSPTSCSAELVEAETKQRLEDLYLPYKPEAPHQGPDRHRGRPGAPGGRDLADPSKPPEAHAAPFVDAERGFADVRAVVEGAREILMERFAENAD
jgi:uncharacterized protein